MSFIKHVGKHGDRRVAILYRTVPGEEHMALVIYPDTLSAAFHDSVMRTIESPAGQDSMQLADAMHRNFLSDGRPMLQTLHTEGKIKKIPTNQIIITPNAQSHVRLDELNKIFDGMASGDEAAKKMADLDANAGLIDPQARHHLPIDETVDADSASIIEEGDGAITDEQLGRQLYQQSQQMAVDAKTLVAESKRLEKEAFQINPALKPKRESKKQSANNVK